MSSSSEPTITTDQPAVEQPVEVAPSTTAAAASAAAEPTKTEEAAVAPTTVVTEATDDNEEEEASFDMPPLPDMRISGAEPEESEEDKHKYTFEDGFVVDYREDPKTADLIAAAEPDADGYRPITWKQLERIFCFQRPAHGFKLVGDISQKHREHWERSKQIRLRDSDGGEGALFFYDDKEPEPHFKWEDIEVGNVMEIRSPRLHKFMDGQDGMRVEHHKSVLRVNRVAFTDDKRLEYGVLNKNNGNAQFALAMKAHAKEEEDERVAKAKGVPYKKVSQHMPNSAAKLVDNAVNFYDMAITHLERTLFVDDPANPSSIATTGEQRREREVKRQTAREALAASFLNIAASQILLKNWSNVEGPCDKALRVSASPALNAKAYFRAGHALLEQGHLRMAEEKLNRADQLTGGGDAKIKELLHRIAVIRFEERKTEREMFQMRQRRRAAAEEAEAAQGAAATVEGFAAAAAAAAAASPSKDAADASAATTTVSTTTNSTGGRMNPNFGIRRSLFGTPQAHLRGVPNFRDLGGLPCNDGKTVTKRFMLFRSSNLYDLTTGAEGEGSNDLRVLTEELGVKTIVDLRNDREIELMCADAKRLRGEGGLAVHMKKLREDRKNDVDDENNKDASSSSGSDDDNENDDDGASTSGSEGDDEETRLAKHSERNRKRRENREKKASERVARREKRAEEKAKREALEKAAPITGPFVDYRDFFTNIKIICGAPPKKSKNNSNSETAEGGDEKNAEAVASFASPTVASPTTTGADASPSSPTTNPSASAAAANKGFIRQLFIYLSSGGNSPSIRDQQDKAALTQQKQSPRRVWMRLMRRQQRVAVPKREPALNDSSSNNENNINNNKKKKPSVDDEIAFALVSRRAILHIDIVTRSFVAVASVWVLLGVAFYFLCFQLKKASQLIARGVVEKGPAYMYQIMVDNQGPEIAQIFALAADEGNYPIVLTCALGKDRTGVIVALLLAAADVKFDFIANDYAQLTNNNLSPSLASNTAPPTNADAAEYLVALQREMGVVGPQWDVADAADIRALFVHLKKRYGGLHAYLRGIGVAPEQVQAIRRILTRPSAAPGL